jgi:hypothetical protein
LTRQLPRFRPVTHLELAVDLFVVPLDRTHREDELLRNFLIGQAFAEELENILLARRLLTSGD